MVKIPPWVWLAVALAAVLAVGVRQSMQAAYYRGIASDAEQRIVVQGSVIDSVTESSVHLAEGLQQAAYLAEQQRLTTEREVTRMGLERIEARERSEALTERLRADLDSVQALDLDSIVISYEIQIGALDSIVVTERKYRMAESLRADAASELVLSLRSLVSEHEAMDLIQTLEVTALRAAMKPSLGLRLKADWWIGAVGLAAGYVLWGTR
tara:strand:+ start:1125 stop:1757 length:633 start_codon:yes stop_codon:yes gene_type:complete